MTKRKGKLLMLCLLTLITIMYSFVSIPVNAEEKLLQVNDGTFVNNELPDLTRSISGKYEASKNYKFISEYNGMYYYNYDVKTASYSNTNELSTAIEEAVTYKKGDAVSIYSNMAGDSVYESFLESYKNYTLLVYDEEGSKKYSIKYTDLPKYMGGTTKKVNVSLNFVSNVTDSVGNVIAKKYSVSGGTVSAVTIGDYYFQNDTESSNFTFDFYGADGTYNYTVELADGYTTTGTITQSGIYVGNDTSNLANDFPAADIEVKNPKLTLSKIPKKKCDSFKLTITSDIDAVISFNGECKDEYNKSETFLIDSNGVFRYTATTSDGGYAEGTIKVNCVKVGSDVEKTTWSDNNWTGSSSSKGSSNNLVQTGIFNNGINFAKYIGAFLVVMGVVILFAKKKGFSLKRGGKNI